MPDRMRVTVVWMVTITAAVAATVTAAVVVMLLLLLIGLRWLLIFAMRRCRWRQRLLGMVVNDDRRRRRPDGRWHTVVVNMI